MKQQFLERCYAQDKRLSSSFRDISTLNCLMMPPQMIDFEMVDINKIVDTAKSDTAIEMHKRGMTFIDNRPLDIKVSGNQSPLYSIFRKPRQRHCIMLATTPTITAVTAKANEDYWNFTFSDNGVGVGKNIWIVFWKVLQSGQRAQSQVGGTGLGLAIVKYAVMLRKGYNTAAYNEGGGLNSAAGRE